MATHIFRDGEAKLFYWIVISICAFALVLGLTQAAQWYLDLVLIIIIAGFLIAGPPIAAQVDPEGNIIFINPISRQKVTPTSLARVWGQGVQAYSAHVLLRNKFGLVIMYRCRKYTNHAQLAQAMLDLIAKAPKAKVREDAIKLLRQTATGSRKPLPLG